MASAKRKPARFRAQVQPGHKGCAVEVPFDPADQWPDWPRLATKIVYQKVRGTPVRGTLAKAKIESFVVSRVDKFFLLLDEELLKAAGVAEGDTTELSIVPSAPAS